MAIFFEHDLYWCPFQEKNQALAEIFGFVTDALAVKQTAATERKTAKAAEEAARKAELEAAKAAAEGAEAALKESEEVPSFMLISSVRDSDLYF